MLRALVLAAALLPALASAQVTITETSDSENGNDQVINIEECSGAKASRFGISWKVPSTAGTVTQVDLRISDTSGCPLTSSSNSAKTTSITNSSGTSGSLATAETAQNLVSIVGYSCAGNQSRPLYVCAVGQLGGTDVTNATQSATIQLDTVTPSQPLNVKVTPGDSALDVSWDAVSGARRYKVTATSGTFTKDSGQVSDTTSHRLGGLQNDVEYSVTVTSYSQGGNPSTPSVAVPGTPVQVNDFWRLYRSEGGSDQGGCGTPGAGALSLLALAALALRRRRRTVLPLVVLAGIGAATPARAVESPRWGSFQFQVTPYRPNVDAEFRGTQFAPYQEAFGGGKHLMFRGEVAYSILKDYGSLDVGLGAGFWQAYGHGRVASGTSQGAVSADATRFRIIPTSLSLTYRLDQLANRGWLPLAPYGRIALERYNWWVVSGTGGTAYARDAVGGTNRRGSGATNGYSLTGGVALLLDFIDRGLAREMDNDTGVNHTYLFGEVTKTKIDDFGSKSSWDLSTDGPVVVSGGLLFVF